jgi:hypothetical protein
VQWRIRRGGRRGRRWALPLLLGAAALVAGPVAAGSVSLSPSLPLLTPDRETYAVRIALPQVWERRTERAPAPAKPRDPLPVAEAVSAEPGEAAAPPRPDERLAALTSPPPPSRPAGRAKAARMPGVIALRYSLAGGAEAEDAIEVAKPVTVAGRDAGRLPIRIDGNAQVFAQGSRVAALLAAHGAPAPDGLGDAFVSLERLRSLGIDVRYDAIRDRLVLEGGYPA